MTRTLKPGKRHPRKLFAAGLVAAAALMLGPPRIADAQVVIPDLSISIQNVTTGLDYWNPYWNGCPHPLCTAVQESGPSVARYFEADIRLTYAGQSNVLRHYRIPLIKAGTMFAGSYSGPYGSATVLGPFTTACRIGNSCAELTSVGYQGFITNGSVVTRRVRFYTNNTGGNPQGILVATVKNYDGTEAAELNRKNNVACRVIGMGDEYVDPPFSLVSHPCNHLFP